PNTSPRTEQWQRVDEYWVQSPAEAVRPDRCHRRRLLFFRTEGGFRVQRGRSAWRFLRPQIIFIFLPPSTLQLNSLNINKQVRVVGWRFQYLEFTNIFRELHLRLIQINIAL